MAGKFKFSQFFFFHRKIKQFLEYFININTFTIGFFEKQMNLKNKVNLQIMENKFMRKKQISEFFPLKKKYSAHNP